MTGTRRPAVRLMVAAVFVLVAVFGTVSVSSAHPSKADVAAAKAKLADLNRHLDLLIEQYNQAHLALGQAQANLDQAQREKTAADAVAHRARDRLEVQAVAAYTGMGSQLNVLLGAKSLTDFSDRLQFVGAIAQNDSDLAIAAQTAGQRAQWAANQFASAVSDRQSKVNALLASKGSIESSISAQAALYQQLNQSYQSFLKAERVAAAAAAAAAANPTAAAANPTATGGGTPNPTGTFAPPPNATAAQTAIAAAESVIGTQYVWGSADPSVGFDCSGLTLWAYAHAGIYLPHSSAAMYDMLPHLSQAELVPGDLLFFYTPVSHVAIYLGGDQMIDASHPGPGGEVAIRPVYWDSFVGGGRVG